MGSGVWSLDFGVWLLRFGAHSNAHDGDMCACAGDAASPGSNLISCSAQCFGAGGKTCVKVYTNNRTVVIGEKQTSCSFADTWHLARPLLMATDADVDAKKVMEEDVAVSCCTIC